MTQETIPKIGVLLATFNGEKYVAQQVASILRQTHKEFRLDILDDCSTDGTYKILKEFADRDVRISLKRSSRNLGIVETFERLLSEVREPYFCLADQDDVWVSDKLAIQLGALQKSGSSLLYSDMEVVNSDLVLIARSMWSHAGVKPLASKEGLALLIRNPVSGCTIFGKSKVLRDCLPFPRGLVTHDWWLAVISAYTGGISYTRVATVKYRQHQRNDTGVEKSGIRGFIARSDKSKGGWRRYLQFRHKRRITLARELEKRHPDADVRKYLEFIDGNLLSRVFRSPAYFWFMVRNARELGYRAIVIEALINLSPR